MHPCHSPPGLDDREGLQRAAHHGPGREGATNLDEACRGEHGHRPSEDGRSAHASRGQRFHVHGMPLDGSRPVVLGEGNGGLQQSRSNATAPIALVDGEAGHPPDARVIIPEELRQCPVATHPGKGRTGPNPGPAGGMIVDIGDEPRRHDGLGDLPVQGTAVVPCRPRRLPAVVEEPLAPAPRSVLSPLAERPYDVAPSIGSGRAYLHRHGADVSFSRGRCRHRPCFHRGRRAP